MSHCPGCNGYAKDWQECEGMDMAAQVTALRERVEEIEHTLREMAECHRETESRLDDIENKAADALSRAENLEIGLDAETERINRMEGV